MIKYKQGNLLDVTSGVIIHGCNAQGVMGSGVAKAIRDKYPKVYQEYINAYDVHGLNVGEVQIIKINKELSIVNAITQQFYGRNPLAVYVSYSGLKQCFYTLSYRMNESLTFHFPKIGAGLGNGDWVIISALIEQACPNRELVCWEL